MKSRERTAEKKDTTKINANADETRAAIRKHSLNLKY